MCVYVCVYVCARHHGQSRVQLVRCGLLQHALRVCVCVCTCVHVITGKAGCSSSGADSFSTPCVCVHVCVYVCARHHGQSRVQLIRCGLLQHALRVCVCVCMHECV